MSIVSAGFAWTRVLWTPRTGSTLRRFRKISQIDQLAEIPQQGQGEICLRFFFTYKIFVLVFE